MAYYFSFRYSITDQMSTSVSEYWIKTYKIILTRFMERITQTMVLIFYNWRMNGSNLSFEEMTEFDFLKMIWIL